MNVGGAGRIIMPNRFSYHTGEALLQDVLRLIMITVDMAGL